MLQVGGMAQVRGLGMSRWLGLGLGPSIDATKLRSSSAAMTLLSYDHLMDHLIQQQNVKYRVAFTMLQVKKTVEAAIHHVIGCSRRTCLQPPFHMVQPRPWASLVVMMKGTELGLVPQSPRH